MIKPTILLRKTISNEILNNIKKMIINTNEKEENNKTIHIFKSISINNDINYKPLIEVFPSSERQRNYNFICITDTQNKTIDYNELIKEKMEQKLQEEMEKTKSENAPHIDPVSPNPGR